MEIIKKKFENGIYILSEDIDLKLRCIVIMHKDQFYLMELKQHIVRYEKDKIFIWWS